MPSDAEKLRKAQEKARKELQQKKRHGMKAENVAAATEALLASGTPTPSATPREDDSAACAAAAENAATSVLEKMSIVAGAETSQTSADRSCTGVLASHRLSRDLHVENFSLTFHGAVLVHDTSLEINYGR